MDFGRSRLIVDWHGDWEEFSSRAAAEPCFHRVQDRADLALVLRDDAFQDAALRAGAAGDQHLLVDGGSSGDDVRLFFQTREQRLPVADSVALNAQQIDVRGRAQQAVLQVLAKAVVDGQRDDERGHAGRHSDDGDDGDDADDGLDGVWPGGNARL
jgi:hypothetical protein